jgi:hypothetical protein
LRREFNSLPGSGFSYGDVFGNVAFVFCGKNIVKKKEFGKI